MKKKFNRKKVEDKEKQDAAFEKRMLDLYVDGGGKIEEFSLLKQVIRLQILVNS